MNEESREFPTFLFAFSQLENITGLYRPLLNVYPLDLEATEAQQATMNFVVMLPGTMKILFGFISDNYPIAGYRRKPYMALGWILVTITMMTLYCFFDLNMAYDADTGASIGPLGAPTIGWLSFTFLLFGMSMWLADVSCRELMYS